MRFQQIEECEECRRGDDWDTFLSFIVALLALVYGVFMGWLAGRREGEQQAGETAAQAAGTGFLLGERAGYKLGHGAGRLSTEEAVREARDIAAEHAGVAGILRAENANACEFARQVAAFVTERVGDGVAGVDPPLPTITVEAEDLYALRRQALERLGDFYKAGKARAGEDCPEHGGAHHGG
jgi:hypothetical protein